jgi:hypothetical protein
MPQRLPVRSLFPLILVPADQPPPSIDTITALDLAVDRALDWWHDALSSFPFDAFPTQSIQTSRPRAASAQPNTQELVREDLAAAHPDLAGRPEAGIVYVVYAELGPDPYQCPGNVIGTSAPYAGAPPMLIVQSSGSLDAFRDGQNPLDPNSGSRDAQTGALAHELGHALSLPHPTDPAVQAQSIMWSWWLFPRIGLSTPEIQQALAYASNWQV